MGSLSQQHHWEGRRGRNGWLCLAIFLVVITVCSAEDTTLASVHDLRSKLFERYDKLVRPVVNETTTTTVYMALTLLSITEIDEDKQIMEMDTWISLYWKDEYLVWNPEEYGGVTLFRIPSTEIWRPDLGIYTGSPASKKTQIEVHTNAMVNYTGDVFWIPPVDIRSRCPQNVDKNPDILTCIVKIGSWTYHGNKIDLQLREDEVDLADFSNSNPYWELISATAERRSRYYPCCSVPFPTVSYNITLRRKSTCRVLRGNPAMPKK